MPRQRNERAADAAPAHDAALKGVVEPKLMSSSPSLNPGASASYNPLALQDAFDDSIELSSEGEAPARVVARPPRGCTAGSLSSGEVDAGRQNVNSRVLGSAAPFGASDTSEGAPLPSSDKPLPSHGASLSSLQLPPPDAGQPRGGAVRIREVEGPRSQTSSQPSD